MVAREISNFIKMENHFRNCNARAKQYRNGNKRANNYICIVSKAFRRLLYTFHPAHIMNKDNNHYLN